MQVIGRIECVADDLPPKVDPKTGEITSVRGVLATFRPTGTFDFSLDKNFIQAGLYEELKNFEGQKMVYSFARVDMDLPDGGRYRTWALRTMPEPLSSLLDDKKVISSPAPQKAPETQSAPKFGADK